MTCFCAASVAAFAVEAGTPAARRWPLRLLSGMLFMTNLYSSAGHAQLPVSNLTLEVEKAARAQLSAAAKSAGLNEPMFDVSVVKTTRAVPPCATAPVIEVQDTRQPQRMRLAAVCGGAGGWRYEFVVRATLSARVLVTAGPVAAGQPLVAEQVTLARRDISAVADSIAEPDEALGLTSRRALRGGELLRKSQLAALPLVKRGQEVRIVARREQVEVSMNGEALDNGAQGEVVRVRNTNSGTVIRARVTGAGQVEPADMARIN